MDTSQTWDADAVRSIAQSLKDKPGALMIILRRVQDDARMGAVATPFQ